MGLPPSKYPSKKTKIGFPFDIWGSETEMWLFKKMKSGLNGFGSNSNVLVLWENDATRLRIIFKLDFWLPEAEKI